MIKVFIILGFIPLFAADIEPPADQDVNKVVNVSDPLREAAEAFEPHISEIVQRFFTTVRDEQSKKRVLTFLSENLSLFKGGRKIVSASTPGAESLKEEEVALINRWQTWTPWVRPDILKSAFDYATAMMRVCLKEAEVPSLADLEYADLEGLSEYVFALAAQDFLPDKNWNKELLEGGIIGLQDKGYSKKARHLTLQGDIKIPNSFLISQADYNDLLNFIYEPLRAMWWEHSSSGSLQLRLLSEMLIYRCALKVGEKDYDCERDVHASMKHYLQNDLSWASQSTASGDRIGSSHSMVKSCAESISAGMKHLQNLCDIHAIPTQGVEKHRALWIRFVDWLSMLHRLSVFATKNTADRHAPNFWKQQEIWKAMRALLSQRLLAGPQVIKPMAEVLTESCSDFPIKIYKALLYNTGTTWHGDSETAPTLQSDLEALACHSVHAMGDVLSASPSSLKILFSLQKGQIQALFTEAALEEVMLACDAVMDFCDDEKNEIRPRDAVRLIETAFKEYTNYKDLPDKSLSFPGKRLHYALQMLSNALSQSDLDDLDEIPVPDAVKGQSYMPQEWREKYRKEFAVGLKKFISQYKKMEYAQIERHADEALAKILPHILSTFDVKKEFPHCWEKSVHTNPAQPEEHKRFKRKVLKVKVCW